MNTTELELIKCLWKQKLLGPYVHDTNGNYIEIIDLGLFNRHDNFTFFNAKIKIDGLLQVGNVMILEHSSEWYTCRFESDERYRNVIMIVAEIADTATAREHESIPVVQAVYSEQMRNNAWGIISQLKGQPECKGHIVEYSPHLSRHAWLSAMQTEWLEWTTGRMRRYHKDERMEWLDIVFNQILRGFGFTVNEVAMDLLARAIPIQAIQNHVDDLFQIEAIIFGQAGLLNRDGTVQEALPERFREKALFEGYFTKLRNEWLYLSHKYDMPMSESRLVWQTYGNGSAHYPNVYLSMLAYWLYRNFHPGITERVLNIKTAKEAFTFFNAHCTPYWQSHNHFGLESKKCMKCLTQDRRSFLTMAVIPTIQFFVGRLRSDEALCDRAFDIMEQVKAFKTPESQAFADYGFYPEDAGDVMAMVWLQHHYCDEKRCLHCRFGVDYIKKH